MIKAYATFSAKNLILHRTIVSLIIFSFFGFALTAAHIESLEMLAGSLCVFPFMLFFAKASSYRKRFIHE